MISFNRSISKSRFTLIELLIVVAIIGILVSILMPALAKARRLSVEVVCLSNETQQYKAYFMFATDNEDSLPTHDDRLAPSLFHYGVTNNSRTNFVTLLKEYTSSFEVWNCPTYGTMKTIDDSSNYRRQNYITYSYFPGRREPNFGQAINSAVSFSAGNATADCVFLQDNIRDHRNMGLGIWTNHSPIAAHVTATNPSGSVRMVPEMGQLYGANILFYDGHAKRVDRKALQDVGPDTPGSGVRVWSVIP